MMRNTKYTNALGKGCGLVEETLTLLSVCQAHTTRDELVQYVRENNPLSRCSDMRSVDIVKLVFYPRFMKQNPDLVMWLQTIRQKGLLLSQFKQILMLYCARENAVMYDFILQCLNPLRAEQAQILERNQIIAFIKDIADKGLAHWGETVQKRQASYIKAVLMDLTLWLVMATSCPMRFPTLTCSISCTSYILQDFPTWLYGTMRIGSCLV